MPRLALRSAALLICSLAALVFASTASASTCRPVSKRATATLHVVGNHMQDSDGNVFVPDGISLVSGPETKFWAQTEKAAVAQIVASRRYWSANTVRIQVSEAKLLDKPTPGHTYNAPLFASVNRLVCMILEQGQIPVINDTTLFTTHSRGPTQRSVLFWELMSKRYGNDFPVIFDIFDEPRLGRNPRTNHFIRPAQVWRVWQHGGKVAGKKYVGMQDLVDTIRVKEKAGNVIWAEQPWYLDAEMLRTAELPQHLLQGQDIVYAFHHVTLDQSSGSFKALAGVAAQGVPLVDSEWSQFAAALRPWECQPNAYKGVPQYLSFVQQAGIGLMAWSLQPGALIKGTPGVLTVHDGNDMDFTTDPRALATPNTIQPDYGCDVRSQGQGAGALIQSFFANVSKPAPAALFPTFE